MRKTLAHLPLAIALAITVAFSTDLAFLRPLKTEQTFGVWVVVLVPIAACCLIAQVALWALAPGLRPWRRQR